MMDEDAVRDFVSKAGDILGPYRDLAGSVLYSNKSTLKRGSILFYGINPGYEQKARHRVCWKIGASLTEFAAGFPDLESEPNKNVKPIPASERLYRDSNLIDDQQWPYVGRGGELSYKWHIGQSPYQSNTRNLLKLVSTNYPVVVGNWFFLQTSSAAGIQVELKNRGLNYDDFREHCWNVHQLIFRLTQPFLLITCEGVISAGRLRRKLTLQLVGERIFSGHLYQGNPTYCQHFTGRWVDESNNAHKIHVCKIPHSSWYNIVGKKYRDNLLVSDWFTDVVRTALR